MFKNKTILEKMTKHLYKEYQKHDRPMSDLELNYVVDSLDQASEYNESVYNGFSFWSELKDIVMSHITFLNDNGYRIELNTFKTFYNKHLKDV